MSLVETGIIAINTLARKDMDDPRHHLTRIDGNPVRVYTCGPTVYSEAHLGHARTYISLDIIRRILTDYFKIPVQWCMNVTDVDDKIIGEFNKGKTGFDTVFEYSGNREKAFFADMDKLNVRRPDSLLRVSEVIEDIKSFIGDLVAKGFAYVVDGSVYFDVPKYIAEGFEYAELESSSFSDKNRQAKKPEDGEKKGKKRADVDLSELGKHDPADFALWKKAKEGEPFWPSEWGNGRPGWHIECSTMSSIFFGDQFDVHCGGIDLRFPHHTNEIAQSQARSGLKPWVRTWWHTGQLNINGEKMAKSTGNFKTIKDAVNTYPWRLVRMMFALVEWDNPLELNDELIENAKNALKAVTNFLQKCEGYLATGGASDVHGYTETDRKFMAFFTEVQDKVKKAFAQNFKVPVAIQAIRDLIREANSEPAPNKGLLIAAARYVRQIMDVLGFNAETVTLSAETTTNLGPVAEAMAHYRQDARGNARALLQDVKNMKDLLGVNTRKPRPENEDEARKFDAVKAVEDRVLAVLSQLDRLRDETLPDLGIKLEDAGDGSVDFKLGNPEEFRKEREAARAAKAKPKPDAKPKQAQPKPAPQEIEHPSTMFRSQTDKYSQWDENGMPTHNKEGEPLTRGQLNRVKKLYDQQLAKWKKAHPES